MDAYEGKLRKTLDAALISAKERDGVDHEFLDLQRAANEVYIQTLLYLERDAATMNYKKAAALGSQLGSAMSTVVKTLGQHEVLIDAFDFYFDETYEAAMNHQPGDPDPPGSIMTSMPKEKK